MDTVEKLKSYRAKIENSPAFDKKLGELIGIDFLSYIENDKELKTKFYDRIDYLKNLAESQEFIDIQDQLFEIINKILKVVDLEEIKKFEKDWNNSFINKLNIPKKDLLKPSELYLALQDKNNYYRLKYRDNTYFSPYEGEISTFTHIVPSKKQYEMIEGFFNNIFHYLQERNKTAFSKMQELLKEYNKIWYKFDEKIFLIPTRLHIKDFEDFFYLCTAIYPREGYEFTFNFNKGSLYSSNSMFYGQLSKIKSYCLTVIDDLIETVDKKEPRKMGLVDGLLYGTPRTKALHKMIVEDKLNSIDSLEEKVENLKEKKQNDEDEDGEDVFSYDGGISSAYENTDLELFILKKILLDHKRRDDAGFFAKEFSFNNNSLGEICRTINKLMEDKILYLSANTRPERFENEEGIEDKDGFINWKMVEKLDKNPKEMSTENNCVIFAMDIIDEVKLKGRIDIAIEEFMNDKIYNGLGYLINKEDVEKEVKNIQQMKIDKEETRKIIYDTIIPKKITYSYEKQREIIIEEITKNNEKELILSLNNFKDKQVDVLKTLLALEKENLLRIKELKSNQTYDKKGNFIGKWSKKDNPVAKVQTLEIYFHKNEKENKYLKSMHLICSSLAVSDNVIFLVLDGHFDFPVRFGVKSKWGESSMKKLFNIAYPADAFGKKVNYDKRLADNINNGLFKKRPIEKYMKTHKLEKPTLVKKSEKNTLVLSGEVPVIIGTIDTIIPPECKSLYLDKTK